MRKKPIENLVRSSAALRIIIIRASSASSRAILHNLHQRHRARSTHQSRRVYIFLSFFKRVLFCYSFRERTQDFLSSAPAAKTSSLVLCIIWKEEQFYHAVALAQFCDEFAEYFQIIRIIRVVVLPVFFFLVVVVFIFFFFFFSSSRSGTTVTVQRCKDGSERKFADYLHANIVGRLIRDQMHVSGQVEERIGERVKVRMSGLGESGDGSH